MPKNKDSFVMHYEFLEPLLGGDFSDSEIAEVVRAMLRYAKDGISPVFKDRALAVHWRHVKERMDADRTAYEERCRRNAENGALGGRPKKDENPEKPTVTQKNPEKPNGFFKNPEKPKKADTDIDTDIDTDKEKKERKKEKKESPPYDEIIAYLNLKAGTAFKASSKDTQSHINARWREGATVEDFKRVINNKCADWLSDKKMSRFLRPKTLFSPKFEDYLNQPRARPKGFKGFTQRDIDFDDLEKKLACRMFES